jgi:hypothetical protein
MTSGLMIGNLGQRIEAVFGEHDLAPRLHEKISALRRMVLLSSMTITLTPRRLAASANS